MQVAVVDYSVPGIQRRVGVRGPAVRNEAEEGLMRGAVLFGLGVMTGGYLAFKGKAKARVIAEQVSPAQLGRTLGRAIGERKVKVSEDMADFLHGVTDGARQREDELRTQMIMPPDHPSTRP